MTNTAQNLQNWMLNPRSLPCNLSQWGLILVEGVDAANFLQSQLTNSVLGLERTLPHKVAQGNNAVRLVGYCSPKGRLIASAWIGLFPSDKDGEDRFALFISKDIATSTAKRLSMYVLRAKVKVIDLSSQWYVSALFGTKEQIENYKLDQDCIALHMPDVLHDGQSVSRLLLARPQEPSYKENDFSDQSQSWNALEVLSAIPRIVLATQEQFVPQMINFESVFGVDFKKGCYPGQEIVARSQYRGAIKRRLQLAHFIKDADLNESIALPGAELFHSDDLTQPAGMVVLSAQNPGEPERLDLQIECKLEALEDGEIHLGSPQGPVLKIDPLPYSLVEI